VAHASFGGRRILASSQGRVVLKITITDLPYEQRWSLQGRLVDEGAAELKSTWREARYTEETRRCIVELIDVTSIDQNGEAILADVMSRVPCASPATCTQNILYGGCAAS
jgi:ABC-type transporter Mla MlaB component